MVLKHTGATASEVFTDSLWAEIEDIYQSILEHPFITELTRGELDLEIFKFYLQQDALYLEDFSRALAITGARAEEPKELQQFIEFAQGAIVTERALHESYFEQYDVDATGPKSPSCFNYTNFLIATASTGSYPESVAALLPCFWIYREVGNYIYKQAVDDNPYQDWIDTYSGEEFGEAVEQAIDITNKVVRRTSERTHAKMKTQFVRSSRLEWMFWDSAYHMEEWLP